MKKLTLAILAAGLAVTAACTTPTKALPAGSDKFPTTSTTIAAGVVKADPVKVTTTTEAAPTASSCDVAREALLTGTPTQIAASLRALVADKTAAVNAREYAGYYLGRDKAEPQLQTMDVSIIRMACS